MKGGKLSKAVEMCFAAKLFDVLQMIADDLKANQVGLRRQASPAAPTLFTPAAPPLGPTRWV